MAYYLQMDGVDDILKSASMTWTEIIIDMYVDHKTSTAQVYIDGRPGAGFTYVIRNTSNNDDYSNFQGQVWIDGVAKTSGTQFVPSLQRTTMRAVRGTNGAATGQVTFFAHNGALQFVKGRIYDIKLYNGATLVAHYDMSTQTVQDQSGNGNHATLTGGTFVDDGAGGGTNVTITGVIATATAESIVPTVSAQKNVSVSSVIANATVEASAPSISTSSEVNVSSVMASATAEALAPSIGSFTHVTIQPAVMEATASAIVPSVSTVRNISIVSSIANATAEAIAAIVGGLWKEGSQASTTWSQGSSSSTTWNSEGSTSTVWS